MIGIPLRIKDYDRQIEKTVIRFCREQADTCFEEAAPLIEKYRREIAYYTDLNLEPDYGRYAALEKANVLRAYTARLDEKIIGFAVFHVATHLHFKSNIFAMHDILYIMPEHRGFGYKFIRWCTEELRADGVSVVYFSVNVNYDYRPLLERMGFEHTDHLYAKRIK